MASLKYITTFLIDHSGRHAHSYLYNYCLRKNAKINRKDIKINNKTQLHKPMYELTIGY